jgi:hypothetical protein
MSFSTSPSSSWTFADSDDESSHGPQRNCTRDVSTQTTVHPTQTTFPPPPPRSDIKEPPGAVILILVFFGCMTYLDDHFRALNKREPEQMGGGKMLAVLMWSMAGTLTLRWLGLVGLCQDLVEE